MDKEMERNICMSFFGKRSRDRLYYELSSPKKRQEFLHRMSHTAEDHLSDCIAGRFTMPPPPEDIAAFLAPGRCYFITSDSHDGQLLDPETALADLYRCGVPYMAVSADCTRGYLETEYNFSEHTAYFLKTRKE